jgi:RNA polymerase sigma-70 factor, ECF subfamily
MFDQMPSDTDLVRDLRSGSRDAFAQLYQRHKDALYDYCSRLLRNGPQAEDIVHDSFLTIWKEAPTLNDLGAFRSWLFSIARHKALNSVRGRKSFDELSEEVIQEDDDPHSIFVRSEESLLLSELLESIRPGFKDLIVLKDVESFSYAEIANITGMSLSSVRIHLFRARKALAKAYSKNHGVKK